MSDNLAPADTALVPPEGEPTPGAKPAEQDVPQTSAEPPASAAKPGMGHVISDEYSYLQPKRGEIRQGRVIAIKEEGIVVDLELKREGFIPQDDVRQVGSDVVAALQVGDEIPVYVLRPENDKEGNVLVSWHRARQEQDWIDAQRIHDASEVWEGKVKGYNRGGLIVPYGKIRGFVPASQITGISRRMDSATLQARLADMVGQMMPLKIIEVDRQNHRLILSERTARREWRAIQREKLLAELQEGDHVHGVVSNICDFGAFVDLGGTDGLVHISELSWRRTNHPSDVVRVGEEVDVYVLRVDRENRRIGLSLRLMQPDPWASVTEKYRVGELVTATITKLIAFGAFAALDDGIEGLIHISELADIPPKHPSDIVEADEILPLRIVKIDAQRRRMGLSLKRVTDEEWAYWQECNKPEALEEEAEPISEEELAGEEPPLEEAQPIGVEELAGEEPPLEEAQPIGVEELAGEEPPLEEAQPISEEEFAGEEPPLEQAQPISEEELAGEEPPLEEAQPISEGEFAGEEPPLEEMPAEPDTSEGTPATPPDETRSASPTPEEEENS